MTATTNAITTTDPPALQFNSFVTLIVFCLVIVSMINPIRFTVPFSVPTAIQSSHSIPIHDNEYNPQESQFVVDQSDPGSRTSWIHRIIWTRTRFTFHLHEGTAPLLGVLVLWITTCIGWNEIYTGIFGTPSFRPFSIVILVLALAYVSISLDMTGVFTAIAIYAARKSGRSAKRFFFYFYLISSIITVLASNDVVVLTLTPIIVYFAKLMNLNPFPYLIAEFHAANTWSAVLLIGNPTNMIAAQLYGLNFFEYFQSMALPGICASLTSFCLLYLVFHKEIPSHMDPPEEFPRPLSAIPDAFSAVFGCLLLISCLVALSVTSLWDVPVWMMTLPAALCMLARDVMGDRVHLFGALKRRSFQEDGESVLLDEMDTGKLKSNKAEAEEECDDTIRKSGTDADITFMQSVDLTSAVPKKDQQDTDTKETQSHIQDIQTLFPRRDPPPLESWSRIIHDFSPTAYEALSRMPWKIGPFVLGMFILVEALSFTGWVEIFSSTLAYLVEGKEPSRKTLAVTIYAFAYVSALACSVMNNQPMTILFTRIVMHPQFNGVVHKSIVKSSVFGLVIGSNLGANLMFHAALAGMMWEKYLARNHIHISSLKFALYGFLVTPPVLAVACFVLWIQLAFIFITV